MFDDATGEVGVFDFDEFADQLVEQGLNTSPAALHGALTGVLTAGAEPKAELGLDALTQALDVDLYGELAERLMQLYTITAAAMVDDEFSFNLLLPDDETEISVRTQAMADWCKGFMAGYAQITAGSEKSREQLTADSQEILDDITAMAEAEAGDDEDDELEQSYMELVEYLRFAVLNVFMDNRLDERDLMPPDQPLH